MTLQINGNSYDAVGSFTINYGAPKRDELVGPDRVHGYKELPQVPYISGMIRDGSALDIPNDILNATNATLTLLLANGKTAMLEQAWYALEGDVDSEEGTLAIKFCGKSATEVPA
jgi:hypothetical protein